MFMVFLNCYSFVREIVTPGTKDRPESTRVVTGTTNFGPFQDILDIQWNDAPPGMLKKTDSSVHVILGRKEFGFNIHL